MLTRVEGIYRNGRIEIEEPPAGVQDETPVIVTFMNTKGVDVEERGVSRSQAEELRAALATFDDWNEPEMDIYDDYDASRSRL